MWYIFLRDYSDTELLISPRYNDKIKELINKLIYMKVEFAFHVLSMDFVNVADRSITPIQEFIQDRRNMYWGDDEEIEIINQLEFEVNKKA
jgi:hypothetical protein